MKQMGIFDRVVVGVDGTEFGSEALRQALALSPAGSAVCAVTALDTSIAVHAGYNMPDVLAQLEEEAERARADAATILGDRPGAQCRIVHGDAKGVLRQTCEEVGATLPFLLDDHPQIEMDFHTKQSFELVPGLGPGRGEHHPAFADDDPLL